MHFYVYPDAALRANLIRALHSSFPHAIEPLHGLRVDRRIGARDELVIRVIDVAVFGKLVVRQPIRCGQSRTQRQTRQEEQACLTSTRT